METVPAVGLAGLPMFRRGRCARCIDLDVPQGQIHGLVGPNVPERQRCSACFGLAIGR